MISTQLMMTVMFRLKLTMKSTPKAECTKILKSQFYQRVHSAQLNDAEYAPLLTAVLLYLNSEGVAAPLASTLAVGGQVIYFWLRAFVGHYLCETPRARHRADAATGATSRCEGA